MLVADITYSPDDGGYYATIWHTDDCREQAVLPKDGVTETLNTLKYMIRAKYDDIKIVVLP